MSGNAVRQQQKHELIKTRTLTSEHTKNKWTRRTINQGTRQHINQGTGSGKKTGLVGCCRLSQGSFVCDLCLFSLWSWQGLTRRTYVCFKCLNVFSLIVLMRLDHRVFACIVLHDSFLSGLDLFIFLLETQMNECHPPTSEANICSKVMHSFLERLSCCKCAEMQTHDCGEHTILFGKIKCCGLEGHYFWNIRTCPVQMTDWALI